MSEDNDKESKTEEATSRRVEDALEKGNMPASREVGLFASIIAVAVALPTTYDTLWKRTVADLTVMFDRIADLRLATPEDAVIVLVNAAHTGASAVVLPLVTFMVLGVLSTVIQHPVRFVGRRVTPQFSRVSPSSGLKRIFSRQNLVEFGKTLVKFAVVAFVIFNFLWRGQAGILNTVTIDPQDLPGVIKIQIGNLFSLVATVMAAIVVADLFWSRFKWRDDLRMSKQEVKDEQKQAEGDPIVRARQRSLARDRSRRRMIAAVPKATMVIANPTHFAVAIRYVREESATPVVVAKGLDNIALKIREIAESHDIPVIEDKALARSLYAAVKPDRPIPPEFYKAVAEIVLFLMARKVPARSTERRAA